jgi:hypothetical protein
MPLECRKGDDEQPIPEVVKPNSAEVDVKVECRQIPGRFHSDLAVKCLSVTEIESEDGYRAGE